MRHKEFMAVPFLLLGAVACGGGGSTASPSVPTTQPLAQWYSQAAGPLGKLSAAYIGLGTGGRSLAQLQGSPEVTELQDAARAGMAVPAPEGRPDIDLAYDQVMTDAVTVSQDISADREDRFNADADAAGAHLDALKTILAGVSPSAS